MPGVEIVREKGFRETKDLLGFGVYRLGVGDMKGFLFLVSCFLFEVFEVFEVFEGFEGFGILNLGFGIWDLGFGSWNLMLGIWDFKGAPPLHFHQYKPVVSLSLNSPFAQADRHNYQVVYGAFPPAFRF